MFAILIAGHNQSNGEDVHNLTGDAGVRRLATKLQAAGMKEDNVQLYAEDPNNVKIGDREATQIDVTHCRDSQPKIMKFIKDQANEWLDKGGLRLMIVGYSHGGGLEWKIANDLSNDSTVSKFTLAFTAYIDAIQNYDNFSDWNPKASEIRLPKNTRYHTNWYQSDPDPIRPEDTDKTPRAPKASEPAGAKTSEEISDNSVIKINVAVERRRDDAGLWGNMQHNEIDDDLLVEDANNVHPRNIRLFD